LENRGRAFRVISAIHETFEAGLLWLVYPLIGVMVADIVARYVFLSPLPWVRDVSTWLFAVPFMLTVAHYYNKRLHISAEDLIYRFRLKDSQRATIDLVHSLILLSVAGFLLWPAVEAVLRSYRIRELSSMTTWRPLLWPFRAVIPVALVLLGAQALLGVVEAIQTIQKVDKT
jgi:TRAP-type mannitol/chloroaromatic compound transport system permease small subunit